MFIAIITYNISKNISLALMGLSLFSLFFSRDPIRISPKNEEIILAAADGKITNISEVKDTVYSNKDAIQISTFLSPLSVHITRSPIEGIVEFYKKESGKHCPAFLKGSKKNARSYTGINNKGINILVIQMVGIVARRLVSWVNTDNNVSAGQKIGFIRLGSRTDIIIPKENIVKIQVKKNDKVRAGETILAKVKKM